MSKPRRSRKTPTTPDWEPPQFVWTIRGPVPVEYTDDIRDDEGNRLAGCAKIYDRVVVVDAGLPREEIEAVLVHEALHLWAHDSGFDDLFRSLEEPFMQSLASWIVSYQKFTR